MTAKVTGNIKHLSQNQIRRVERLYQRKLEASELVPREFATEVYQIAEELRRRVGVMIDREGEVVEVFIGTREILYLPDLGRYRVAGGRFRRLRLIFSDLSKDASTVSIPKDIYTDLEKLRLDAVCGVKVLGARTMAAWAYVLPYNKENRSHVHTESIKDLSNHSLNFSEFISQLEAEHLSSTVSGKQLDDGALLVGVYDCSAAEATASMNELRELVRTAGVKICGEYIQRRKPDPRTLIGKGKVEELVLEALRLGAEMMIFDTELKPSQWRALTNSTELKILDRSMVILDIFAQRATSSDGRLQVELAQLKYNLPRLVEKDAGLSRLVGGIGGRGPGETKLEIGRRRIRDKIAQLERQIKVLGQQRDIQRGRRVKKGLPLVSILGYTNAGKSTLFNSLSNSGVLTEDKLFATLDTNQSTISVPIRFSGDSNTGVTEYTEYLSIVISDTVGFIRELPEELVVAFKATLEELHEAQLLVHVLDAADTRIREKYTAVQTILKELELQDRPCITVLNKVDLISTDMCAELTAEYSAVPVSAVNGHGFDIVKHEIGLYFQKSFTPKYHRWTQYE